MIKYAMQPIEVDEYVWMKLKSSQWSFILILWLLVIVYTKFHLHETLLFFFFLKYMLYHHFYLYDMLFNGNETL